MDSTDGLLSSKTAVIYGAGGSMGFRVARAFAGEGARVFAVGRSAAPLQALVKGTWPDPGSIAVDTFDALDAAAIEDHLDQVRASARAIDISFNLIGVDDVQGQPLVEMSLQDYMRPIEIGMRSHFLTGTAAARRMAEKGAGVIMALTATPSRLALPLVGGFGAYCAGVEGFYRTLAAEVGETGVRVVWIRSAGSPETFAPDVAADSTGAAAGLADQGYLEELRRQTLLKRFPRAEEIAGLAVLLASDRASALTAAAANATCGHIVD